MCRIAQDSVAIYDSVTRDGERLWYGVGGLEVATTPERTQELKRRQGYARSYGIEGTELLSPAEAAQKSPLLDPSTILGAYWVPSDGGAKAVDIMIATATIDQLEKVIDYADHKLEAIDGMSVIFGNNGMNDMKEIYELLHKKILECRKPLFPILPSISSSHTELESFMNKGNVNFPDEVVLGRALTRISNTPYPAEEKIFLEKIDIPAIRKIIDSSETGYLSPSVIQKLLKAANIPIVEEAVAATRKELNALAEKISFPLVLKVVGPVHKSDVGGVTLNIGGRGARGSPVPRRCAARRSSSI